MALSPTMNVMLRAAEKAARSLIRDFGEVEQLQVSRKGPGDFVSAADHRAEEIIHGELSKARPDYAFLMEESGAVGDKNAEYCWIIDPLDGTSNFLHGVPHWCISIGLEHNKEIIAGVVYDPVRDEMFRAEKGTGAFMRNKRLRVSGRALLDSAMIATGQPARDHRESDQFMGEYHAVLKNCAGIRRFGAAALDLSYVAAGRYEGFWERGLKAWDMAAGYLIIKEAGGIATTIDDRKMPVHEGNIIAGNDQLFEPLRKLVKDAGQKKDAA